ncbi:MAG: nicotinate phosphoribosyltransferase [Promethearchaeota archaeon]
MRKPKPDLIPPTRLGMITDLYQLTMANGYSALDKEDEIATFDLFVRELPKNRSYLMVCGLESVLYYLTTVRFAEEDIELLRNKPVFKNAKEKFWEYLADFRFTGEVWAMPEGTIAFGNEPLMIVIAPIIEAQVVETYLLSCYNHQTKIASKAARCVEAAKGTAVVEFGTRRTDVGAAIRGAKAAYIGGCVGTSNVMTEVLFGIPSFGTQAHSWIMSFESEEEAFDAYFQVYGSETLALIDTYDTIQGAKNAAMLPGSIKGVRLDSGDMTKLSVSVREILDAAGKKEGMIFASSDLNEYKIEAMLNKGAKIDAWGVGTELILSRDAPTLGGVYKLALLEKNGKIIPKLKLSEDKMTYPDFKQVYRSINNKEELQEDILGVRGEFDGEMKGLLVPVIKKGKLVYDLPEPSDVRSYGIKNRESLPSKFRQIKADQSYEVKISPELEELTKDLISKFNHI